MGRKIGILAGVLAVAALGFASAAPAATVTYSVTVDNSGANYAAGESGAFTLPQFDPSLGTLQGVKVTVTGNSFGGSNVLDNESVNPGTASVSIGSNISVTGPLIVVLTFPQQTNAGVIAWDNETGNPDTNHNDPDYAGTDSISISGTSSQDVNDDTLTSNLSAYIGTGTVPFGFTSAANTSNSASVSPTYSTTTPPNFNFGAEIEYTYAVPEPATMGLLLLGGLGLVGRKLRRRG